MPDTLQRYIFWEIARAFLFALAAMLLIFLVGTTFRLIHEGLSYGRLLRVLPFALPYMLPYSMPFALLVAVTLAYGRLVADNELLALRASGVSPLATGVPALLLGGILALFSLVLESSVIPYCHSVKKEIERRVLEDLLDLEQGEHMSRAFDDFDLYVRAYDHGRLEGVVLHREEGGNPMIVVARHGLLALNEEKTAIELRLEEVSLGVATWREEAFVRFTRIRLDEYVHRLPLATERSQRLDCQSNRALLVSLAEAARRRSEIGCLGGVGAAFLASRARDPDSIRQEFVERACTSLTPLLFALLGFLAALLLQHGNRLVPLFLGVIFVAGGFYAPYLVGRTMADRGALPYWGALLGPAVTLLLAGGLGWGVTRR